MSQSKYTREILERTMMLDTKEASTPMATTTSLSKFDGSTSDEAEEFRKLIGSLQYLIITRLDISFVENKLA